MTVGAPGSSNPRRRTITIVVVVLAVAALLATGAVVGFLRGASTTTGPTATRTPAISPSPLPLSSSSATASPDPSATPTFDPVYGAPVAQAAPKGQTAAFPDGVEATITSLQTVDASGTGVGDSSGPAVRITVRFRNGSSSAFDASVVQINAYARNGDPATPLSSNSGTKAEGIVSPGDTVTGVWEFSIPREDQSGLTVEVARPGTASVVVFD